MASPCPLITSNYGQFSPLIVLIMAKSPKRVSTFIVLFICVVFISVRLQVKLKYLWKLISSINWNLGSQLTFQVPLGFPSKLMDYILNLEPWSHWNVQRARSRLGAHRDNTFNIINAKVCEDGWMDVYYFFTLNDWTNLNEIWHWDIL